MASTASPMGAEPVGTLSASGSFAANVRHIPIGTTYGTSIFYGDFVKLVSTGTLEKDTGTTTMTPVGIFMGCFYTDPTTKQPTYSQYWPAANAATDAVGYVFDDPNGLFRIQADDTLAQTALGNNIPVVQTAGSTAIGRSKVAADASLINTTSSLPLRIIDFVKGPNSAVGDAFTDIICTFNDGHQYVTTTGV
jgi:hypothetical protein